MRNWIIILLVSVFLAGLMGCGKRTAPTPIIRPATERSVSSTEEASARLRGNTLELTWTIMAKGRTRQGSPQAPQTGNKKPERSATEKNDFIQTFQVDIEKRSDSCTSCSRELLGSIQIDPATNAISAEYTPAGHEYLNRQLDASRFKSRLSGSQSFTLVLPVDMFMESFFQSNGSFVLSYNYASGDRYVSTKLLNPIFPKKIPTPEITVKKLVTIIDLSSQIEIQDFIDNYAEFLTTRDIVTSFSRDEAGVTDAFMAINGYQEWLLLAPPDINGGSGVTFYIRQSGFMPYSVNCERASFSYDIYLEWSPELEFYSHSIDQGGKRLESGSVYGLNLYTAVPNQTLSDSGPAEEMNEIRLINSSPLRYGTFHLKNLTTPLIARYVDRHGNESEQVIVFNGRYDE